MYDTARWESYKKMAKVYDIEARSPRNMQNLEMLKDFLLSGNAKYENPLIV